MNISRFFIKFALFSLIFSAIQPTFTMNEPTTLGSRLKNFITSPKTVAVLSLCTLIPYGYKTGNWNIALSLLGASFGLYTFLDYRRDMAWRRELKRVVPKENDNKEEYNQNNIQKSIELLDKINDQSLNQKMSYWTHTELEKALKKIISNKKIDDESAKTIVNLVPIIKKDSSKLKVNIGKLYSHIKSYNVLGNQKNILDQEIENIYANIKSSLYSIPL